MQKKLLLSLFLIIGASNMATKIYAATTPELYEQAGLYLVVEGIEGCGKSTFIKGLHTALQQKQLPVVCTKEPGGSALGLEIRKILEHRTAPTSPVAEFLLFAADRAQHFAEKVIPYLAQGITILSDRSCYSALAYQGYLKSVNKEMITAVNSWAMQQMEPDVIFYLRIEPEVAKNRAIQRNEINSFEAEILPRMQTLHEAFDELFNNHPHVIIIDAQLPAQAMVEQALTALQKKYPERFVAPNMYNQQEQQLHDY